MAGRNANGEGTIYKRKDGRYEASGFFPTTSGSAKRVRFYGRTRHEVHDKLVAAKTQVRQGIALPDHSWSVGEYLDYWLENAVSIKRRPLTYRRHEAVVRLHLKPHLAHHRLHNLSVQVVQHFVDQLHRNGQSAAGVGQARKVLSAALTYAVRMELLHRNVARLVELPRYKPPEGRYWTADEAQTFLRAAHDDPLYPAFVLLLLYGLRSGEVRGLRWCDVDLDDGVLRIRQQVQRIDGSMRAVPLKTDSSRRDEPLLPIAQQVLDRQRQQQAAARAVASDAWQGTGDETELVLTTRHGRPIEARNLYRSFVRICTQHDIRLITLHGLRHTNATTQKKLQVHDRDIQAILGHGDVRTTGLYAHVDMDSKREALTKVEQRLFRRAAGSTQCRTLPSIDGSRVDLIAFLQRKYLSVTEVLSGGSSQTRTGDTRLFSKGWVAISERLTEVDLAVQHIQMSWRLGIVAVKLCL